MQSDVDWRRVSDNPDPAADLGYELIDLDVLPTTVEGRSRVLVLPSDEDMLREDAFLVVDEGTLCDLDGMA